MIPPEMIRKELRKRPFRPFRLHLSDGTEYLVNHPDNCLVGRGFLVIPEYTPGDEFPTGREHAVGVIGERFDDQIAAYTV